MTRPPSDPTTSLEGQRSRLPLVLGLSLVFAVSAAWSTVALLGRPAPAPIPSVVAATAIPPQAPGGAVGNLHMFSQTTGWAQRLGDGAVLHTTRGVLRWTVATPPTADPLIAVAYVDATTALALSAPAGSGGQTALRSWATGDAGATWVAEGGLDVAGFSPDLVGTLDYVDRDHGWFSELEVGPGLSGTAVYRTLDGGRTWSAVTVAGTVAPAGGAPSVPVPAGCVDLIATFATDSAGWLTGSCPTGPAPLFASHDGGASWTYQGLDPGAGAAARETTFPPDFTSAWDGTLLTESLGAAVVRTALFTTHDQGATWSLGYAATGTTMGYEFVDPEHGWLLLQSANGDAAAADLLETGNGGVTWSLAGAFPYAATELDFLTPEVGWAFTVVSQYTGGASYLLGTVDGGRSWAGLQPGISASATAG